LAQRLGQVTHLIEIRSAPLVYPAEQLGGLKRFSPSPSQKTAKPSRSNSRRLAVMWVGTG